MDNKILVTGAAGFIGYHLTKSLLNDGFSVLGVDNLNDYYDVELKQARLNQLISHKNFIFNKIDIANKNQIEEVFLNNRISKVVNLAAQAGVRYSIDNPYAYLESNLVGFLNIIELCRHNHVEGLIYASSSSVYGSNIKTPFDINDKTDSPISLYAATKKSNELIASSYSHLYDLNTTGLRFFTVYGPWGRPDMAYYIFTDKIINNQPIKVFNNGNLKRDFTYIDDIVFGIKAAIKKNYKCEIFNLGNNKSENIMDLIRLIENRLKRKASIDYQPIQKGDVKETYASIGKSCEMLNYSPKIDIKKGIHKFIDWYKTFNN